MTLIHFPMSKKKATSRRIICPDSIIYSKPGCLSHTSLRNKQMVTFHETKWSIPISQLQNPHLQKTKEEQSGFPYPEFFYRAHQRGRRSKTNPVQVPEPGRLWAEAQALCLLYLVSGWGTTFLSLTFLYNLQHSTDCALLIANQATPHTC